MRGSIRRRGRTYTWYLSVLDPAIVRVDSVEKMRSAIKNAGGKSMIQVYPEAGHGFNADYRPSYREMDAKDAWQRMLIWFRKYKVS